MAGSDRVKPARPGVKLTYDDFVLFPDDGQRHELIDGEHYVTPSPIPNHQIISGNLYLVIGSWLEEHPIGRIVYAPLGQRDETIKPRLYERAGVTGYWFVDPETGTVRVYGRRPNGFVRAVEHSREAGDILTTDLLPGVELPLARIFRE
jgi:Uma2 family endonuclease